MLVLKTNPNTQKLVQTPTGYIKGVVKNFKFLGESNSIFYVDPIFLV